MKICPVCQESNHDAADLCMLCGASLPELPSQDQALGEEDAELLLPSEPAPPPRDTLAVAVYHDAEPRVVAFFPLGGDITAIGREDAGAGHFPDIDFSKLSERGVGVAFVSRRHARFLRHGGRVLLEVLAGTTGTQVNRALVAPGRTVVLSPGDRIILGGRVRMKLMQF